MSTAYDCFLSYASPDFVLAETIHARLTGEGFRVWFDRARLQPGYDWHKEIEEGCETSRVALPLLTPRWKQSEWTRYETYGAEAVIPLLVEGLWEDASTPPLTPFQNFCVPLASATGADWQRLFDSIREFCAREVPQKEERVHRLRYHPAKHFVGREKDLEEIHEKLFTNPTAALTQGHVQAIAAMGGVGKTTLARQYAEKFWRCYPQMFWADCRLGLETEFAAVHDILRPEPMYAALSTKDKAGWVRFEFSQSANHPRRLLILDNAEDEDSVLEWIPKTGDCHTLITSRFTDWSPGIETYRVWVLDPEPARELLLRRSARADNPAERGACDALAKKLEYLPLALEQAAAYVGAQPLGWGFVEYLVLYEAHERAFLMEKTAGATEYPHSVYLTWRATIDKLPEGARAILRLHAFLASTPVPVAMFVRGEDEFDVRKSIASLAKYSMAQLPAGDSFSVHGLVHAVEWHAMGEERAAVLARMTEMFLGYAERPSWEAESRRMWDVLLPHAVRLNVAAERVGVGQNVGLLEHTWQAYNARGDYRAAILFARQCLVLREQKSGPEHPDTLAAVDNLAGLYDRQGRYAEAEPLYLRALRDQERALGPGHPNTLVSVNNLALLYQRQGRYGDAEPLYRRALRDSERVLGPEHPDTLLSVNNLAELYERQGRYADAEPLFWRALRSSEHVRGPEHPSTLTLVNNLAGLNESQGRYAEAEPLYLRALRGRERVLGPEHPDTLGSVNNLAFLYQRRGRYTEAEPLYRRALRENERVLGPEHPSTLVSVNNLAWLCASQGRYAEAEPLHQRALRDRERVLGPEHPDALTSVSNLAGLYQSQGRYAEAEPLYLRALRDRERVLGPEHPSTLVSANNLAFLYAGQERYLEAEPLYRRALRGRERVLGPEHPDTLASVNNLASLYAGQGRLVEAEPLFRRALSDRERVLGPEHPDTLVAVNDLALLYASQWRYAKAEPLYRRALEAAERVLGPNHPDTVTFRENLADMLRSRGSER